MSTPTLRNRIEKVGFREAFDSWWVNLNRAFDVVDYSLDGVLAIDCSGLSGRTLASVDYEVSEARARCVRLFNVPANFVLTVPDGEKLRFVTADGPFSIRTPTQAPTNAFSGLTVVQTENARLQVFSPMAQSLTQVAVAPVLASSVVGGAILVPPGVPTVTLDAGFKPGDVIEVKSLGAPVTIDALGSTFIEVAFSANLPAAPTLTIPANGIAEIVCVAGNPRSFCFLGQGTLS